MIIKTKNYKFMPHVKTILILLLISLIPFALGFLFGEAKGWAQCVDFGLKFVNTDNIIDKTLIRSAILQYKGSLGGWAFDSNSPFYIGNGT